MNSYWIQVPLAFHPVLVSSLRPSVLQSPWEVEMVVLVVVVVGAPASPAQPNGNDAFSVEKSCRMTISITESTFQEIIHATFVSLCSSGRITGRRICGSSMVPPFPRPLRKHQSDDRMEEDPLPPGTIRDIMKVVEIEGRQRKIRIHEVEKRRLLILNFNV
jgi:hypothetical protein